jgi:predicted SprT family Zn-dependent metalloprotease
MRLFEQLDLFRSLARGIVAGGAAFATRGHEKAPASPTNNSGLDEALEALARELLRGQGADRLALRVRVEWNNRLRTAAGRAAFHHALVSLNPRLREHGAAEIDRTLRHELAHLLAHDRAGRRRISPHGPEWRRACRDLGIADEQRCHTLPFPTARRQRRLIYRCPRCTREFPRVRRIRRAVACLACCRAHNGGKFAKEFQLRLVRRLEAG